MRTIEPPSSDAEHLYESITSRRAVGAQQRLTAVRSAVFDAYSDYAAGPADLTSLVPLATDADTWADLKANYPTLGRTQADLRDAWLAAVPNGRCPLCGDRAATTLDHYLPRGTYPEFAVYPLNLVPCCQDCNFAKLDDLVVSDRAGGGPVGAAPAFALES